LPGTAADKRNREADPPSCADRHRGFHILASIALVLQAGLLFLALFQPGLPYIVSNPRADPLDSPQFLRTLAALTDGQVSENSRMEVLTNGEQFYPAELEAIRMAKHTISMESYITEDGKVERAILDALIERTQRGVKVHFVADAVGSYGLSRQEFQRLVEAGGEFAWYMPVRWYTWPRINNRTHRELLIIDGRIGFIGGAGWADHWLYPESKTKPRWRDTMLRVEGPAVIGLQATFSENWLEASGKVITGEDYFPFDGGQGGSTAVVVRSSPTTGRSTAARVLFQLLLASARHRIYITTPYFLPDDSIRDELARAIRERGVQVQIVTPGAGTDHMLTRRSSRRLFGPLLRAGAHIYEFQGPMIHTKVLLIDGQWAVVGSTNFDPRSFTLNDEVNLATPDSQVVQRLEKDFLKDVAHSREVTYAEWSKRGLMERLHELFGGLIEHQE
jgi:cardiolipin synthase A/B